MKARIVNGKDWGGNYTQDYLDNNSELVSEWVLTDILPNREKTPEWNGSVWYEAYVEVIVVPEELHRMKIFLELADRSITRAGLKQIVSSVPSEMLSDIQKERIFVKIDTAQTFKIDDENLVLLAPIVGITDLQEFFISANQQQ